MLELLKLIVLSWGAVVKRFFLRLFCKHERQRAPDMAFFAEMRRLKFNVTCCRCGRVKAMTGKEIQERFER